MRSIFILQDEVHLFLFLNGLLLHKVYRYKQTISLQMDEYLSLVFSSLLLVGASFVAVLWFLQRRSPPSLPGPRGIPVLGFLPWIDPKAPHLTFTRLAKVYGPIYALKLGSMFTVVLSDHRLIRQALAKDAFSGRAPLYVTHGIMKGYGESIISHLLEMK